MNEYTLALQAKKDIETLGGISISTGYALQAMGYNVEKLEAMIIKSTGASANIKGNK